MIRRIVVTFLLLLCVGYGKIAVAAWNQGGWCHAQSRTPCNRYNRCAAAGHPSWNSSCSPSGLCGSSNRTNHGHGAYFNGRWCCNNQGWIVSRAGHAYETLFWSWGNPSGIRRDPIDVCGARSTGIAISCEPGFHRVGATGSSCNSCPAGTFRSSSGGTNIQTCSPCPAGSMCPIPRMENPIPCDDGDFQPSQGQTHCNVQCWANHSCSADRGTPCAIGSYSGLGDMTCFACTNRPANIEGDHFRYTTNAAVNNCGVSALRCAPGFYLRTGTSTVVPNCTIHTCTCEECPPNNYCAGGTAMPVCADSFWPGGRINHTLHCVACPTAGSGIPNCETCTPCEVGTPGRRPDGTCCTDCACTCVGNNNDAPRCPNVVCPRSRYPRTDEDFECGARCPAGLHLTTNISRNPNTGHMSNRPTNNNLRRLISGPGNSCLRQEDTEPNNTNNPCIACPLPELVSRWRWALTDPLETPAHLTSNTDNCSFRIESCYRRGFGCLPGQTSMCTGLDLESSPVHFDLTDPDWITACRDKSHDRQAVCSMVQYPMNQLGIPLNIRPPQRTPISGTEN